MNKIDLKTAIEVFLHEVSPDTAHLPVETIYRLSLENGLKNATEKELGHLSQCRSCLEKWEIFSIAWDSDRDEVETEDPYLSFGMLKAASTETVGQMHLKSDCRRFVLGVHPDSENPANGLVTLDIIEDSPSMEGMMVSIRDAAQKTVLERVIVGGRAAVKREDLDLLDLSAWTISFTRGRGMDTNA
ncbi:MAG: hypothetical protein MI892_08185 [Desulfobacterales bacterium]|nr:hypothetical protein [Desulfobacterales bacterium]